MNELRVRTAIGKAKAVHRNAQLAREELRWRSRKHSPERNERIEENLRRIAEAMVPIRSEIGKSLWEPLPSELDKSLRAVSQSLQYEARQLKKMRA